MKRSAVPLFVALAGFLCLAGADAGGISANAGRPGLSVPSPVVMGYFPCWKRSEFDHTMIVYGRLTHIVNAFAWPDAGGNLVLPEDYDYPELVRRAHQNGVKVILGLGGWGNCAGFPPMAADSAVRAGFIARVTDFCRDRGYDGVDVDWEFVETEAMSADFSRFIGELSAALKALTPPRQLTMAAPAGDYYGRWIDYENLHALFDYIGFMTYDFHGPWSDHSGHNAPLYGAGDACGSMDETFLYARARGVPARKILLGLPFYGRTFDTSFLYDSFRTSGEASYREIATGPMSGWPSRLDSGAMVPFLLKPGGGMIVSYDDEFSIGRKCLYVLGADAAGVIIWEISQDRVAGASVLLEAVGNAFSRKGGLP